MAIVKDPTSGLYYRDNKGELFIIKEQSQYSGLDFNQKKVMDVGGNIGCFTNYALTHGAHTVYTYEPTPDTFKVLKKNFGTDIRAILNEVALTGSSEPTVTLNLGKTYPATNTIRPVRGRNSIEVKAKNFWKELAFVKPSVVKVDIEGGEYEFMLDRVLPKYVDQLAIELHTTNAETLRMAHELVKLYEDWYSHRWFKLNWHVATMVVSRSRPSDMKVKDVIKRWGK